MITIVLKDIQLPENLGMIARSMLNFNLMNLSVVNPLYADIINDAKASSCGALDIINVNIYDDLSNALSNANLVVALSARQRDLTTQHLSITDLPHIINQQSNDSKIAILFGCEKNGLSNNDIANANYIVSIPTNKDFGSLNIANAVAIVCFYIKQNLSYNKVKSINNMALFTELDYFYNDLFTKLSSVGFFSERTREQITKNNVKAIFKKANLTSNEIKTLIGINKMLYGRQQKNF